MVARCGGRHGELLVFQGTHAPSASQLSPLQFLLCEAGRLEVSEGGYFSSLMSKAREGWSLIISFSLINYSGETCI